MPTVLARGRWPVPEALAASTSGPRAPLGVVLSAGARVHPILLVHHPLGRCPGPVVRGFAPGSQPMGRVGKYSGCGVVWCAEGAVSKRQWPGCLAYGNSKTGWGVCIMCGRWSLLLCLFVGAAGSVQRGGHVRPPWLRRVGGAAFAPPPPPRPRAIALWAGLPLPPDRSVWGPVLPIPLPPELLVWWLMLRLLLLPGVVWCGVVWCGVLCCGVLCCGVVWCGVVWCGVVWCGVVWCGVVWCGGVVASKEPRHRVPHLCHAGPQAPAQAAGAGPAAWPAAAASVELGLGPGPLAGAATAQRPAVHGEGQIDAPGTCPGPRAGPGPSPCHFCCCGPGPWLHHPLEQGPWSAPPAGDPGRQSTERRSGSGSGTWQPLKT